MGELLLISKPLGTIKKTMKTIFTIFFTLIWINVTSQQTKKVKHKISSNEKEIFYVLATDESVKHGKYEYFKSKQLIREGYYKEGKKDSLWCKYIWNGSKTIEGFYKDDLKNGNWIFYGFNENKIKEGKFENEKRIGKWKLYFKGKLIQKFDFDNDELIVIDRNLTDANKIVIGGKYDGLRMVDKYASYFDGPDELIKFIHKNFKRSNDPENENISGRIIVSARLNLDGTFTDFKIDKKLIPSLDNQLMEILKLTEGNWYLAEFNNKKVSTRISIPLYYDN